MIRGLVVSGVSTGVGKTYISRGLTASLRRRGDTVRALKPLETGVEPAAGPLDAIALARASGDPSLADLPGLYRHPLPLAPYAAALHTGAPPPVIADLVAAVRRVQSRPGFLLVEGAGGLLVPIDARNTNAELAAELGFPLLLVARDELGVLASVLSCVESARARKLQIAAVVLSRHAPIDLDIDPSPATNHRILQERLELPVLRFGVSADNDDALAHEAERSGLLALLHAEPEAIAER